MTLSSLPLAALGTLLGGIGLFLLGMTMLSEGLKLAAGRALERILAAWTRTPLHGLLTGVFLTALVQSSTAMTVATIGFVNAGLLSFSSALWVVFGSNLGSSITGWLVAWLGFAVKVDAFALPFIGIGMGLLITGSGTKRGALGQAIAGFGVLFLGIEMLRQGFVGLGPQALPPLDSNFTGLLVAVLIGLGMTIVMQASSATLAVVLTAVSSGSLSVEVGAGMVIGANVGTTLTGILAAIKATPNARRLAGAHVLFNVVTAVVAFALLSPMLKAIAALSVSLLGKNDPVTQLVIFHTAFNALGVLLMWPLAKPLARFLQNRFRNAEDDASRPRFLDNNVLAVPHLAVQALHREMERFGHMSTQLAIDAMQLAPIQSTQNGQHTDARPAPVAPHPSSRFARKLQTIEQLHLQIGNFVSDLGRQPLAKDVAPQLPELLRIATYYDTLARLANQSAQYLMQSQSDHQSSYATNHADTEDEPTMQRLYNAVAPCCAAALDFFCAADPLNKSPAESLTAAREQFDQTYEAAKVSMLQAGAQGTLAVAAVHEWVTQLSDLRRSIDQAHKAAVRIAALPSLLSAPNAEGNA